ncbi:STE/STE20 protein kinase [Fonticula alba]|uniref:STE/STE20 protein kinase n=1 Tax=Fonticula alba TaxID=691883 RepID=A0A058ZFL4_FONAL|nr:STE/STE20 protein kinase [Fonticula alba]KCV72746.1 STE/STE20 protein kinase [Fonticula alba]|eukprot:XP_009492447.1 STE/STE20 protein kinase [Fonticula alba]
MSSATPGNAPPLQRKRSLADIFRRKPFRRRGSSQSAYGYHEQGSTDPAPSRPPPPIPNHLLRQDPMSLSVSSLSDIHTAGLPAHLRPPYCSSLADYDIHLTPIGHGSSGRVVVYLALQNLISSHSVPSSQSTSAHELSQPSASSSGHHHSPSPHSLHTASRFFALKCIRVSFERLEATMRGICLWRQMILSHPHILPILATFTADPLPNEDGDGEADSLGADAVSSGNLSAGDALPPVVWDFEEGDPVPDAGEALEDRDICVWLLMPLMSGGSVSGLISQAAAAATTATSAPEARDSDNDDAPGPGHMPGSGLNDFQFVVCLLRPVLRAMVYLHSHGLVHNDIRAEHILVDPDGQVRLTGLSNMSLFSQRPEYFCSLARQAAEGQCSAQMWDPAVAASGAISPEAHTFIGEPDWMAPELLAQDSTYGPAVDIYAFGITCLEMIYGCTPYSDWPQMKIFIDKLDRPFPPLPRTVKEGFPPAFYRLIVACLSRNPKDRPTALQILSHEIFTTPPPVVRPLVPPPFLPGSVTHPDQDPLGYANALYVSRYLEGNSEHSSEEGGASDSDTFYS